MSKYQRVAALGSSFAAGPGIDPVADAAAMRSTKNYAHLLAEGLGAELFDLTVSGATTANVIDTPQQIGEGLEYPPQIDGIPANTDLVTITVGGNDLRFAPALLHVAWSRVDPKSPIVAMLEPMVPDGIPRPSGSVVEEATRGLVQVIEGVRAAAHSARVLLVDYLRVLDEASSDATPFSDHEVGQFLLLQHAIDQVFRDAAARTGAEIVLASSLSEGHSLGSSEPWVQPFHPNLLMTAGSFHPNETGMRAIATELERVLAS